MEPLWEESWTEVWTTGHGHTRSYCGIARTEDGFAVDVFVGDSCIASSTYATRREAETAALLLRGSSTPSLAEIARESRRLPLSMSVGGSLRH